MRGKSAQGCGKRKAVVSESNPDVSFSRSREEIAFLTELTYTLRRQVRVNLSRMSVLMSRVAGVQVNAEELDSLFSGLARDLRLEEIRQATLEDLLAGVEGRQ